MARRWRVWAFEALLKRRPTFRLWEDLERSQWEAPEALRARQLLALKAIVAHAWERCPFYREEWGRRGLSPRALVELEDWGKFPVLTRDEVRARGDGLRAAPFSGRRHKSATGGSTGTPVQFEFDDASYFRRTAATYRGYSWAGAGPGSRTLHLWGGRVAPAPWTVKAKEAAHHALYGRTMFDSFRLGPEAMPDLLDLLRRVRPDALVAFVNPLDAFARWLLERGEAPPRLGSIVVGAEKIYPHQRERIERALGAKVFETYGSREFMIIGAESPAHDGLLLAAENQVVEAVDEEGRPLPPGEEGDLLVTDLYNYAMPLLRYSIGDRGALASGPSPCGRGLPRLERVTGRRLDLLRAPDGRIVSGELFPHLLKDHPAIEKFQAVQDRPDHVELKLVLKGEWPADQRAWAEAELRRHLGPSLRLDLVEVQEVPLTAAGKHLVVVNRVG